MQTPAKQAARTASKLQCLLICALVWVCCIPVHAKVNVWQADPSHNPDGQLASQTWPDGSQQSFAYEQGRLKQIQLPDQSQISIHRYDWLLPREISTPGATISQTPDALQRLAGLEVKTGAHSLLKRSYQYDAAGNISQIDSDAGKTDYAYDKLGRLTQASPDSALQALGLPSEHYSYDPAGNHTSSAHQAGQWHYNQDNQLTQYPRTVNPHEPGSATEQTDVSYTPQGHTQKESSASWQRSYSYNASERLTQISTQTSTQTGSNSGSTDSTLTVSYRYDPFGRRISKTVSEGGTAQTTYYLNGDSALLAEADDEGKLTKAYGFNPDTQAQELDLWSTDPIWQAELNGKTHLSEASYHYITTDHLGTPILATDKSGAKSWRSYSEAFGRAGIEQGSSANINLRLPGQYFDPETGLHQNWFRDYSPSRGRYVQSDPIGLWGGLNTYGYAYNDPLAYIDPTGEVVPLVIQGVLWGIFIEAGSQISLNYIAGCSWDNMENYDFWDIFVSGSIGAIGLPGVIGGIKALKIKTTSSGLKNRSKNEIIRRKMERARNREIMNYKKNIAAGLWINLGLEGTAGEMLKDVNGDSRKCSC